MSTNPWLEIEVRSEEDLPLQLRRLEVAARKVLQAGGPIFIGARREKRSAKQNRKLWPMLADVSRQVEWYGQKLSAEDWKTMFSAGLKGQRAVPGIDGGFVVLGTSTSRLDKQTFAELIELIYAFGADHQVRWSEPALAYYERIAAFLRKQRGTEVREAA